MMLKKYFFVMITLILFFTFVSQIETVNAAPAAQGEDASLSSNVKLSDPLNLPEDNTAIPTLLGRIIKYVLGIIGSLALVMFIYGGATWMLSGGNQERVTKGKQIIIWAALGIIIIFTAYALVKFVLDAMTGG